MVLNLKCCKITHKKFFSQVGEDKLTKILSLCKGKELILCDLPKLGIKTETGKSCR